MIHYPPVALGGRDERRAFTDRRRRAGAARPDASPTTATGQTIINGPLFPAGDKGEVPTRTQRHRETGTGPHGPRTPDYRHWSVGQSAGRPASPGLRRDGSKMSRQSGDSILRSGQGKMKEKKG
ncbi:hypothetical protein PGT21_000487 [Puccinia graminis f. sp. tritici]|uniref:Uncharacterized protein n=1 Tax=Puccinia graminis f. sp. tritici TaxID=56615 RepID=A0A5B0MZN3_PUCGR|nr:hypothetical protein PGT21_000487 [Puccinia graminis f. sp. tritici]